jgi:peptide/nickel transport system permease protein
VTAWARTGIAAVAWRRERRVGWRLRGVVYASLLMLVALAVLGPVLVPGSANSSHILDALQPPSSHHWFGTDQQGRDVLARVVLGAQASLLSTVVAVTGFNAIALVVATVATAGGSVVDQVLMRIVDSVLAMPPIIFALGLAAALGPSLKSAIIAITLTAWPYNARLLRGIMRETMQKDFVEGARVLGVSRVRLMLRHVLPNSLDVMIVKVAGDIGNTVIVLGALSFIGVGAQPPSAEWGASITTAQTQVTIAWWPAFFPGVAIAIAAVTFALLGDIVQRRFTPDLDRR